MKNNIPEGNSVQMDNDFFEEFDKEGKGIFANTLDWGNNEMNEKYNFKIWDENWEEELKIDPKVQEEINKYTK
jgi:hypothetical protein